MSSSIKVSVYHDTRRKKQNGKYPVKIQIYSKSTDGRKQQRFVKLSKALDNLGQTDLTTDEFEKSYLVKNPKGKYFQIGKIIREEELRARKIAEDLGSFSFKEFERLYYGDYSIGLDGAFMDYIERLRSLSRYKTADGYNHSLVALKKFASQQGLDGGLIDFQSVTPEFLREFENWMMKQGRSINTVSIYLRYLRSIFNQAIEKGLISKSLYPFGKAESKFTIAATKNVKRALNEEEIKALYNVPIETWYEERAKRYWFLSYALNGINMKDLAELKEEDFVDGVIEFYRAKTASTSRTNRQKIVLPVSDFAADLINQICSEESPSTPYILPIYSLKMDVKEKEAKRRDLIKNINYNIAKLSVRAELSQKVTTYHARHSYTTMAIVKGASLELLRETLGHKDLKTTMSYVGSFGRNKLMDISDKVTEFLD